MMVNWYREAPHLYRPFRYAPDGDTILVPLCNTHARPRCATGSVTWWRSGAAGLRCAEAGCVNAEQEVDDDPQR